MNDVLAGIKVVEVASWMFIPSGGSVLVDWGADVIKVEPIEGGDPQRGLVSSGLIPGAGGVNFMFEIPNRGKRSVAINLASEEGRELLYQLVEQADVFVTNYLPSIRAKLKIDVEDIRARNPKIIYARGSGYGSQGPETDRGGFDGASFWARSGLANGFTPPDSEWPVPQQAAFGDVLGGLTIAGGITAALLKRERTGEPSVVDISLLAMGLWANAPGVTAAKLYENVEIPSFDRDSIPNPLCGSYPTKDGRFIDLVLLQADRYWPEFTEVIERPEWRDDERFKDGVQRYMNRTELIKMIREVFRERTYAEWNDKLTALTGVWSGQATALETHEDPMVQANHYLEPITVESGETFVLPANPVQFDQTPASVKAAPAHGEHTDEVLLELGLDYDKIIEHKVSGAIL
jgi:crotonobetainyl-CoA:carnitine CoA-transferase CaiB-like acyl-CoA transferase